MKKDVLQRNYLFGQALQNFIAFSDVSLSLLQREVFPEKEFIENGVLSLGHRDLTRSVKKGAPVEQL